ncbi:hypothetical protein JQ628_16360 [Bradyrhizobium lablabi]|uniref:hypothetical protein n=1 Tax=Bradyrhizobium lablabi TaxID=722472 RepID=UPI001BA4F517|nr:hypothetical protein [Bradyrhizobium lablabi]MBR1123101.1 hypothetical protein [Bradyrhizobium lablabi]
MMRWVAIAALSAVAMLATLHVWFNVFQIPLEFPPALSLFEQPRSWTGLGDSRKAGWMAWYVPVLTTAFFASVVLARLTRQRTRWSVLSMAIAGCIAVLVGVMIACWAEHNGFIWYHRTEMTLRMLLGVQGQLLTFSFWESVRFLSGQWPLLVIGAVVGAGCAFLAGAPLRRPRAGAFAEETTVEPLDGRTDLTARIVSTIVLFIFSQTGSTFGHPFFMLAAGTCIAIAWFTVAFPKVEFNLKRLLLGGLIASIAGSLVQTVLFAKKNPLAVTFAKNPFVGEIIFAQNVQAFVMIFIMYLIGLTLIFMLFAKVMVALCRRRTSP